jgi:hypothetical protein
MAKAMPLFAAIRGDLYMDKRFESINLHIQDCGFFGSLND